MEVTNLHLVTLRFPQGCNISSSITCGLDLIKVLFQDNMSGFDGFLTSLDSRISHRRRLFTKTGIHYGYAISFNVNGVGYVATYNLYPARIEITFGALRDYGEHGHAERKWEFLQRVYGHYKEHRFRIKELHFAIDLPYWYADIHISPKKYTEPSKYPSSLYFDTRKRRKKASKHNITVYDKSFKAGFAVPMTRIELRLEDDVMKKFRTQCVITNSTAQEELKRVIDHKFREIIVKKGSHEIPLGWECDRFVPIVATMEYIRGDSSLLDYLMSYYTEELKYASKLFRHFIIECRKQGITKLLQKLPVPMPYLASLPSHDRKALESTVASFYRWDKKWYKDDKYLGVPTATSKRKYSRVNELTQEQKTEMVLMHLNGISMKKIGLNFGLSEATVSRALRKRRIRKERVRLEDSMFILIR